MIRGMLRFVDWASRLIAPAEGVWMALDDFGAGRRLRRLRMRPEFEHDRRLRARFAVVFWMLVGALLLGAVALAFAISLAARGESVPPVTWLRTGEVFLLTVTLLYFAWRAWLGWYWAFSRLRTFTRVFPTVTLVLAAIPGFYPTWFVVVQIVFGLLMMTVGELLDIDRFREAYRGPNADAARRPDAPAD